MVKKVGVFLGIPGKKKSPKTPPNGQIILQRTTNSIQRNPEIPPFGNIYAYFLGVFLHFWRIFKISLDSRVHPSEQETRKRARHNCFVSHETGLAGRLHVSVSQVETKHLDFQGFFETGPEGPELED